MHGTIYSVYVQPLQLDMLKQQMHDVDASTHLIRHSINSVRLAKKAFDT